MIRGVKLRNFGPHENFEVVFKPGLNLVIGPNGSGKSNLVYGLGWAPLGVKALPPEYVQSNIIRDGTTIVEAEVEIDIRKQAHLFSRSFEGKNVFAEVKVGAATDPVLQVVATTATGVADYLNGLGIDWDAASVLFSRQRELDAFVYEPPAVRKRIFDSLLQTQAIDEARIYARRLLRDHNVEAPEILSFDPVQMAAEQLVEKKKAQKYADELEESVQALSMKEDARQVLTKQVTDYDPQERITLEREAARWEVVIEECIVKNQQGQVIVDLASEITEKPEDLEAALAEIEGSQQRLSGDMRKLQQQRDGLIGKKQALDELREQLASGTCPTCGTEIDDVDAHIQQTHDVGQLDTHIDDFDLHLSVMAQEFNEVDRASSLMREALKTLRFAAAAQVVIEDRRGEIAKYRGLRAALAEQIAALPAPPDETVADALQVLDKEIAEIHEHRRQLLQRRDTAQQSVSNLERLLQEYAEAEAEFEEAKTQSVVWATSLDHLTMFRDRVLRDALQWVSVRATQILRQVGTIPDVTEETELFLDTDLDFWLQNGDASTRRPVYRFSGGQKAVFAICLRIALSDYFSDRLGLEGFLILDAVLDSLDAENRDAMAAALEAAGPQQAIIFSHFDVPELEAYRVWL